jgi:DNA-binding NarL/FixJ family response regulator
MNTAAQKSRNDRIIRMYEAGIPKAQIARSLDVSISAVKNATNKLKPSNDCHQGVGEKSVQAARDQRFVRALALAFQRGDHLPGVGR